VNTLHENAAALVAGGKGILAADESISTMSKRLEAAGVEPSETARRDYRELLLTTPGLGNSVAGIILCDETLRQDLADGTPFPVAAVGSGIQAGIKVDTGTSLLPNSDGGLITEGLDGLRGRLEQYRDLGATFAKWRAVIDPRGLNRRTVLANAHALARYATLCQDTGIVPIVEPEVLMDGNHGIAICQAVTTNALEALFSELDRQGADPAGLVLKPNIPVMFRSADVVVVNKIDLLPHLDFDMSLFLANLRQVNPAVTTIEVSARTGEGVEQWCNWIRSQQE
jgi:fructose-bisphosphate aldolase class I